MTLTTAGANKLLVCDSGVNSAAFTKQPNKSARWRRFLLKEESRKKLVVYSGGMQKERGIEDILQVAARHPDIMFAFAGGTDRDINIWYDYTKAKKINNVRFLGYLPQAEACSLQQSADILLSTRANDYRATITSPLKFFEYLASETPIVSTKINALQNLDTEGLAVSWYEAGDLIELEKKIFSTFAKFPKGGKCYSQNSSFAKKFTWEERQKKILNQILDIKQ
jgi:glycosyltransferase involved in cell wall biosynthesis